MSQSTQRTTKPLAFRLLLIAVVMFGFGFLLVPLYDIFCAIAGTRSSIEQVAEVDVGSSDVISREVTIEMIGNLSNSAPWEFHPTERLKVVDTGGIYETTYLARNLLSQDLTATAAPDIRPVEAAKYFKKIECFCFTPQEFGPEESKNMPIRFLVSKDLPEHIDRITLSYTLYATPKVASSN